MKLKVEYNKKWFVYIIAFFLLVAGIMLVSEIYHEKKVRTEVLNAKLNDYAGIVHKAIDRYQLNSDLTRLDSLMLLLSGDSIRITVIDRKGSVLYDSKIKDATSMENHGNRPEILEALQKGVGTNVRISETTKIKYYYYARNYGDFLIRVSDRYDQSTRNILEPDRIFALFLLFLLLIATVTVIYLTDKFGRSIITLRDFTVKALENKPIVEKFEFPSTELGNIGQEIIEIYQNLNRTKEELVSEKAKLIRHLNMLDEGIAIYSRDKQVITSNNNFIRFINYVSDTRVFTADEFFRIQDFNPIFSFIERYLKDHVTDMTDLLPTYEITMNKGGRYFSVKCIVFQDKSFEVSLNDVTKPTKRKILKQQLTENIAHELKTPVSSIKGFLETIIDGKPDKERAHNYLKRAYSQACRLADLVHDISLLTKIEEAGSLYQIEEVNLSELIRDFLVEVRDKMEAKRISVTLKIPDSLIIQGNGGLLYSIFRNLFENTIEHAGGNLIIRLENDYSDMDYYYFTYSDTGIGVPDEDLPRIFERFYRVDKGRDRKKGGTGLGLAIVKNAVQFHKGDISVKNKNGGGLEFQFTLAKDVRSRTD